jgi:hypothetical protein
MTAEFLYRIRKEFTITASALREAVIAVAERVNRKVQILQLHYHADYVAAQMRAVQQEAGVRVATLLAGAASAGDPLVQSQAEPLLIESAGRLRALKKELAQIDGRIGLMELETVREELSQIHSDLAMRSAALRRAVVEPGSPASGQPAGALPLPSGRVAAVLRGAAVLTALDGVVLQAGDVVVMVGLEQDLAPVLPRLFARPSAAEVRAAAGAGLTIL